MKPQKFEVSKDFEPSDASAAIIQFRSKFLLQKRDANPDVIYGGYWGLFGGAIESGESPKEAVVREVREEINILIDPSWLTELAYAPLGQKSDRMISRFYFYDAIDESKAKDIRLTEGQDFAFFDLNELKELHVAPYDQFIVDLYAARINA
jgi:8-oxo-dGTP diphosphatase